MKSSLIVGLLALFAGHSLGQVPLSSGDIEKVRDLHHHVAAGLVQPGLPPLPGGAPGQSAAELRDLLQRALTTLGSAINQTAPQNGDACVQVVSQAQMGGPNVPAAMSVPHPNDPNQKRYLRLSREWLCRFYNALRGPGGGLPPATPPGPPAPGRPLGQPGGNVQASSIMIHEMAHMTNPSLAGDYELNYAHPSYWGNEPAELQLCVAALRDAVMRLGPEFDSIRKEQAGAATYMRAFGAANPQAMHEDCEDWKARVRVQIFSSTTYARVLVSNVCGWRNSECAQKYKTNPKVVALFQEIAAACQPGGHIHLGLDAVIRDSERTLTWVDSYQCP